MKLGNWNDVNKELDKLYLDIFKDIDVNDLDFYTKRKMIFTYLCENIRYDYELLDQIRINGINQNYRLKRNPYFEIESIFKYKKGICNAISQVYKLLLEKVGIYSLCVICDDSTDVKHQLNLVYDEINDTFSFDDITSVIVNRGDRDSFFDYDIEDANKHKQGCRPIYDNEYWKYLSTDYIYFIVGRKDSNYLKYNIETSDTLNIPENIVSNKKRTKRL